MFSIIQTIKFSLAIFILNLIIVITMRNFGFLKSKPQGTDKGRLELNS